MYTPATIGKPGHGPTLASTKSFRYPLFVVMLTVFLLLPAAVKTCRAKLLQNCMDKSKEHGSPSSQLVPFTDTGCISLQDAVNAFVKDGEDWIGGDIYGENISDWDVSEVTSFRGLFQKLNTFNDDIGDWDVSSGIDFDSMFRGATAFNQYIGGWDMPIY
eukprot:scaffold60533_cov45-Attheya_sp.AAC.1